MTSRLAKKFAVNKAAETQGILYEETDYEGPLFQVRLARIGGGNKKLKERLNELQKPYRRMKTDDIPAHILEKVYMQAVCQAVVIPHTWQTWVVSEENPEGKYVDGIEDPATGSLLPATSENYLKVLGQLKELFDRLVNEATDFNNYRLAALDDESKNS